MFVLRLVSAVSLIYFTLQLAKEPENLEGLASFTNESMNDLFNWGNDRFVLGRLADHGGNSTIKRKKSPQEIFMEAILDPEAADESEPKKEEEPVNTTTESHEDTQATSEEDEEVDPRDLLDRDSLGGDDDEEDKQATSQEDL